MNVFKKRLLLLSLTAVLIAGPAALAQQEVASHPRDLVFEGLDFEPPDASLYRHELAHGAVAFVVEDHDLPLVNIALTIRTGSFTAPGRAKPGVASLTGSQLRSGGTTALAPADFDEELDFLAASVGSRIGSTSGSASVNCLTKDVEVCLGLFFEMLREPRFDTERMNLAKSQSLQAMERRNDSTTAIEGREWSRLMYGTEHFSTHAVTADELDALTTEDLSTFHEFAVHPGNFIFAVSGDVVPEAVITALNSYLADWPVGETAGAVPEPGFEPQPGLYMVHKEDVNQGRVSLGHLGARLGNPDRYALQIMNHILGGGGFTSRVMSQVRSDEGLAYSAGTGFGFGVHYDGSFRAFFQSRSEAVARATAIVLEEIRRAGLYRELWQTFGVLPAIRSVGVQGDGRTYAYPLILSAVTSDDAMTADWARLPYEVLEKISSRVINEVPGINRVAYDISSKPPATIEWE